MIQIKSKGYIKQNVNNHHVEGVKWNADYDGNEANIQLDVNHNGHIQRRKIQLPNAQLSTLAKLLSVPSVNKPLEKRILDDYDHDNDEMEGSLFQNYISTPRRMRRQQQTPQIVRIKLEPMMEEQEFLENEYEVDEEDDDDDDDDEEYQDLQRMEQLLNPPSLNRSHKKNPKYKKYPTHKVRFSPRNSSRTKRRITLRGGRKKRNTRRRLKR